MKYYIELTLINSLEMPFFVLWSKLYTQLHLALVEIQDANKQVPVGVSFPEYKFVENDGKNFAALGSKIRLLAEKEETLIQLNLEKWLERLTDYIHIKRITSVPEKISGYLVVSRYRFSASPEQLAKRYSKRHNISEQEALERFKGYRRDVPVCPYIQLKSLSNNESFNFFISQKDAVSRQEGFFSTYGLSSVATVPHW